MKKIYFLFLVFSAILFTAQDYSLNLKKLIQVNTYNGGQLVQSVLDNNGNTFFTGFANGNDYHLDGYIINPIGLEDLYLIKTDPAGNHLWEKTLNAGAKGTIRPKFIKVDNSGNSYVIANFNGIVNIGSNTFNSSTSNGILIKLDSSGSYLWATQIADSNLKDYDICFGNNEVFVLSSSSFLYRINLIDGSIINSFTSTNLTSIDYKDSSLYVGGYAIIASNIGNITLEANSGFVLKGDNNFNFDSYLKFNSKDAIPIIAVVKDVKFLADGSLEVVGISNYVVDLKSSTGSSATFESAHTNNATYLWAAKIKSDFSNIDWFKGNQLIGSFGFANNRANSYDIEIYPFGDSQSKIIYKSDDPRSVFGQTTFFNGFYSNSSDYLLKSLVLDITKNGTENTNYSYWVSVANENITFNNVNNVETLLTYDQKSIFAAKKFNYVNSFYTEYWSKNIYIYHGGTIKSNYLKSDISGNSYINNVISGSVNFLGSPSGNGYTNYSNLYSKISPNGELNWKAEIISTSSKISGYYAYFNDVNTDGEMVTTVETLNGGAYFISNTNVVTALPSGYSSNAPPTNHIVKLSSNGEFLWSKRINCDGFDTPIVMTFFDNDKNIIVWASKAPLIKFDGQTFNNQGFIAKLDGQTGSTLFLKSYSGLDYSTGKIVFDQQNSIYAFYEPYDFSTEYNNFKIGNISISGNGDGLNSLMVKLDTNGNPIFGKNFYENIPPQTYKYSWPIDVKYDGTNFIQYNVILGEQSTFIGLDGTQITSPYGGNSNTVLSNSLSKITKEGNVLGTTPIFSFNSSWDGSKIDLDENGNTYIYGSWKGNLNINNQEFALSNNGYTSSILKFSPYGIINYVKTLYNQPYPNYYTQKISIVKENVFNISGNISANNFLGEPINFVGADNYYLATLEESYLQTIEAINKNFSIYPNPSSDFINISTKEKINNIEIYDSTGRKVTAEFNLNNQIDIRKLIKGVYYIRITTDKNNLTSKFIKN